MKKLNNILLIDDDPVITFLNETLIEELRITRKTTIATDGKEALQSLNKLCHSKKAEDLPQIIFLDLNMPVMDGFDFLDAYQYLEFKKKDSVVIVISTSSLNAYDLERVHRYHTNEYIVKPLTKEKLLYLMEKYFGWEKT